MNCPKCGLMLAVKDHIETEDKVVVRSTCNNPQCPNYHVIVVESVEDAEDK